MIIPRSKKARDNAVDEIADICLSSKRDRDQLYNMRKRYFYFGTTDFMMDVKYNRLEAHLDLVASFLYAAEHCRYNIAAPRNADEKTINQVLSLEDEWNDTFRDCGLANTFSDVVLWALVLDSMFIKMGWSDSRRDLFGKVFYPGDFSVFDESEPDIDSQEAFIHTYCLNHSNAVQRLERAGKRADIKKLTRYPGQYSDNMPAVLANILINSTGGQNLAGAMTGRVTTDYQVRPTYEAASDNPMVRFHEIWVWDDDCNDYAIFHKADGIDGVLSDSRETYLAMMKADPALAKSKYSNESNIFGIEQEHPFVHVCPYPLHDFFWGRAHTDKLIPLQVWTNDRLQQIADLLEQNVDPSKIASGFMGLTDEKMEALGGPGTFVYDMVPGAKVEFERPPIVPDLFAEFKEIGSIFLEASGLTQIVTGHGDEGVRGEKQAKRMATTGSGRIKKAAVALEAPLVKLAEVGIKLIQRNSDVRMHTDDKQVLLPAQVADDRLKIRVAGHSQSPLFADESKELAAALFKSHAIDREMLVTMLNPPNKDAILHRLRKMIQAENAQKQAENQNQQEHHPKPHKQAA